MLINNSSSPVNIIMWIPDFSYLTELHTTRWDSNNCFVKFSGAAETTSRAVLQISC